MTDYSNVSFKNNGKLKLLIIVGTRPEVHMIPGWTHNIINLSGWKIW